MNIKYIIKVPFTVDRETIGPLPVWWLEERFAFFRDYTLKSLLGQTFKDYDIWMLCGLWRKRYTDKYPWHERLKIVYDSGVSKLERIDADYISITRIDSDDLMHKDAMQEIKNEVEQAVDSIDKKGFLIFRDNLCWNMVEGNNFVSKHVRVHPPFFTEIFPKKVYKNKELFSSMTGHPHGKAHVDADYYKALSVNKICVVKHYHNNSNVKHNREPVIMSEERWQDNLKKGKVISKDKDVMKGYLKDFGVKHG